MAFLAMAEGFAPKIVEEMKSKESGPTSQGKAARSRSTGRPARRTKRRARGSLRALHQSQSSGNTAPSAPDTARCHRLASGSLR